VTDTPLSPTINGVPATYVRVFVPYTGPWFADVITDGARALSGRVTLTVGSLTLVGTIDPLANGARSDQQYARVVAGAGAWGRSVLPKAYHNDLGVKALTVAQDAAREVGESMGVVAPIVPVIGRDYVREVGPASRVLEDAIGTTPWWVDYNGVTQVSARTPSAAVTGTYEVMEYQPRDRMVELALDDLTAVGIGSVLVDGLDAPQTVRGLEMDITEERVRVFAWCGASGRDRIAELFEGIVRRIVADTLHGKYRYRVVSMDVDRVKLQVVSARTRLPDILPVSMVPGIAGAHAQLTPGAEVFVEFEEGDRTKPIITGFAGKDGVGFVPVSMTLDATTEVVLGGTGATPVALKSDLSTLLGAISGAAVGSADGGAAFKANILSALSSAGFPVSATKVKAL
jgi:hypothetical protein